MLGGYHLIHGAWSEFSTFKFKYDEEMLCCCPKSLIYTSIHLRRLTHIVLSLNASTRLTPIHQCALLKYSTHITFLHHIVNPSRVHAGIIQGFNVVKKHEEWMFMWEHEFWMILNKLIIKLKNINEIDVIRMFEHERLSKEFLFIDSKILAYFWVYVPFRKTLTLKYAI